MAVRRELVFDECGGASRRRRQAHVLFNSTNLCNQLAQTVQAETESGEEATFALTRLQIVAFPSPPHYSLFFRFLPPPFGFSGGLV